MNVQDSSDDSSDCDSSDPPPPNLLKLLIPINKIKDYINSRTNQEGIFRGQWHYFSCLEHYKSYIVDHYNGWSLERLERFVEKTNKKNERVEDKVLV